MSNRSAFALLCVLAGCCPAPETRPPRALNCIWGQKPGDIFRVSITCSSVEEFPMKLGTLKKSARVEAVAFLEFLEADLEQGAPCKLRLESWKLIVPASGRVRYDLGTKPRGGVRQVHARLFANGQLRVETPDEDWDPAYEGFVNLFEAAIPACEAYGRTWSMDARTGTDVAWEEDGYSAQRDMVSFTGRVSDPVPKFETGLDPLDTWWGSPHSPRWGRLNVKLRIRASFNRREGRLQRIDRYDQIEWGHEREVEFRQTLFLEASVTKELGSPARTDSKEKEEE